MNFLLILKYGARLYGDGVGGNCPTDLRLVALRKTIQNIRYNKPRESIQDSPNAS